MAAIPGAITNRCTAGCTRKWVICATLHLMAAINNLVISVLSRAGLINNTCPRRMLGWDRTGGLRTLDLLGL
jgi:hypothetical protein